MFYFIVFLFVLIAIIALIVVLAEGKPTYTPQHRSHQQKSMDRISKFTHPTKKKRR